MTANSEARKRDEERVRVVERRREMVQTALGCVYSGAGFLEADAFLDALDDLGGRVNP